MAEEQLNLTLKRMLEFCSNSEPKRTHPLDAPYINRGRIVASDARILIAIDPSRADFNVSALREDGPDLAPKLFPFDHDSVPKESWMDVPDVVVPMKPCPTCHETGKTTRCKTCNGEGEIPCTCTTCGHEHERTCPTCGGGGRYPGGEEETCHECNGNGRIVDVMEIAHPMGPIKLNKVYLDKIRRNLPNPKIELVQSQNDSNPVRFKFDGGLGYLMQIRRDFP